MLEKELKRLNTKTENPVLVEELLRDIVVEFTVQCLLFSFLCHTRELLLNAPFRKRAKL